MLILLYGKVLANLTKRVLTAVVLLQVNQLLRDQLARPTTAKKQLAPAFVTNILTQIYYGSEAQQGERPVQPSSYERKKFKLFLLLHDVKETS